MQKSIQTQAYRNMIAWLKHSREQKKLTMRDVGERLGVTHSWVGKVEQLERRLDLYEYAQLCEVLEVDAKQGLDHLRW